MNSTIGDVARLAGVSITTVSRVINNNYPVKKETRQAVEKAIKELNYKPNPLAQGLIRKRSGTIGIVVPSITNMFFTEVISGIEKQVKQEGYDILLSNSNGDATAEAQGALKLVNRYVDGLIVVDPQQKNFTSGFYNDIAERLPLISVNGYNDRARVNFVYTNEEKGSLDALDYLYSLGHRKIAFVRGGDSRSYDIKEAVYKNYIKKIKSKEIIIDTRDGNSIEVVNNTLGAIVNINEESYKIAEEITAFFACNDLMAVGILNGCAEIGLRVPEDISIIGFDNIILSEMIKTKLTTVDQSMKSVGRIAAESILKLINNNELRAENVLIETSLIIRESCKKV